MHNKANVMFTIIHPTRVIFNIGVNLLLHLKVKYYIALHNLDNTSINFNNNTIGILNFVMFYVN